jgi:hypothetical protein
MRKYTWTRGSRFAAVLCAAVVIAGCGKTHPVKLFVGPQMKAGTIEKVAVLPFQSSLAHADDPDNVAPTTMDAIFLKQLDNRNDYKFSSPRSVLYAIQGEGLDAGLQQFVDDWRNHQKVDQAFLSKLAYTLQVDAILIGVVDLWQKTEVDVRENAAPTTYVGATITMLSAKDGSTLFQASDENFIEGPRSEAGERQIMRSGAGQIRSDPGAQVYRAPDPKEVAAKVVRALVMSIPRR